jgi:putative ABC transport system substrate-binding protein
VRRRDFIGLAGGAVGWPLGALAQQGERMRRIGVLANLPENDPVEQSRFVAFQEALKQFGWAPGRNLRIDYRSTVGDAERTRRFAAELVALAEDCILAVGGAVMASLQEATSTVPVVFVLLPDPVGGGVVQSLSHPGGNATGFTPFEYGISGKWLELLKEIAPLLTRVAVIRDPASPEGPAQFASIQAVAPLLGIDISPIGVRNPKEIESAIAAFAGSSKNAGLAVTGSALTAVHYKLIVTLAARYKLPAAYFNRFFVDAGGLISYGPDFVEQYRRAAGYVDRILRG